MNHKIESQSRKNLQTQVARIKQTIEKAVDKATFLAERICTLNHDQGSTMISVLTSLVCPLREKYLNTEFLLVHILSVFGLNTEKISVFSPNTGKYGPEKTMLFTIQQSYRY